MTWPRARVTPAWAIWTASLRATAIRTACANDIAPGGAGDRGGVGTPTRPDTPAAGAAPGVPASDRTATNQLARAR